MRILAEPAENESDRRCEPRFGLFSFADICDADGAAIVEATVRDISEHGAHLRIKSAMPIPEMLIVRSSRGRRSYPARLIWMSGTDIGVEFDDALYALGER